MKIARFTDLYTAQCFATDHHERLRFVPAREKWLVYDGKRWTTDDAGRAARARRQGWS